MSSIEFSGKSGKAAAHVHLGLRLVDVVLHISLLNSGSAQAGNRLKKDNAPTNAIECIGVSGQWGCAIISDYFWEV